MQPSTALVVNPTKVEDTAALLEQVRAACARHGAPAPELLETTKQDTGEQMTSAALDRGASLVLAAGGDGTVTAVSCALNGTGTPLGILPLGTGNLLARNLGLPLEVEDALAVALTGRDQPLDLARVTVGQGEPTCFVVMAGLGFDADMMADAPDKLKSAVGWPAYLVSGLRHLRDKPMRVQLGFDGAAPVARRARGVVIGNVGQLQGGVALLPDAVPTDGILDVVLLGPRHAADWARVLGRLVTRSSRQDHTLERWTARQVEVRTVEPAQAELDGEPVGAAASLTVAVLPGALLVRLPA